VITILLDYLESVVDSQVKSTGNGGQLHCDCPFCDDHKKRFYVSTETHQVHCFNCDNPGSNGSFISFIMSIEGVSFEKAKLRYTDILGTAYIPEEIVRELKEHVFKPDISDIIGKRAIPLPDEYVPLSLDSKNLVNQRAIRYLMQRKVSCKQILDHKMGFCVDGEYRNRIIIPITENGKLKFWVARAIGNKVYGSLKEKSPSNEDYQISKSQVIFNIYTASTVFNSAVLSEGIFDSLAFGDIGVSLLGKRLYDDQLAILLEYKEYLTRGVYIALDYDARKNATDLAEELCHYMPVKIINIPEKYDDPNKFAQKLGKKELTLLMDEAVEYNDMYKLKRKFFVV